MALVTNLEADTFLSASSVWAGLTEGVKTSSIVDATRFLNSLKWKGVVSSRAQADSYPRVGVYDRENRYIDATEIPEAIKEACAQLALKRASGESLYPDYSKQKVRSKAVDGGPVSVRTEWEGGSSEPKHKYPEIYVLFEEFLLDTSEIMRF